MIGAYLTGSASWERKTGDGFYGPTYAAATPIAVRWEHRRRLVRTRDGKDVLSESRVFTTAPVNVNDRITDPAGVTRIVLSVRPHVGLSGQEVFREVTL